MHSQKQSCWMGFLSICLTGVLLLNQGVQSQYDEDFEDATTSPDYNDYNSTFEYNFYSNASDDELDKFLGVNEDLDPEDDVVAVYDEEGPEVTATAVTIMTTTERGQVQFSKAASLPVTWVHWSLLLVSLQLVHTL